MHGTERLLPRAKEAVSVLSSDERPEELRAEEMTESSGNRKDAEAEEAAALSSFMSLACQDTLGQYLQWNAYVPPSVSSR